MKIRARGKVSLESDDYIWGDFKAATNTGYIKRTIQIASKREEKLHENETRPWEVPCQSDYP